MAHGYGGRQEGARPTGVKCNEGQARGRLGWGMGMSHSLLVSTPHPLNCVGKGFTALGPPSHLEDGMATAMPWHYHEDTESHSQQQPAGQGSS